MEPTAYAAPTPWFKRKLVWVFLLVLVLIPTGSWLYASYFRKSSPPPSPAPPVATSSASIKEEDLPIALNILQNPMVYEWRGSVEGTLTAKDDKSITLKKDGEKVVIPIDPLATKFLPQSAIVKGELNKSLAFEELAINDYLQGDFFVFPNENGKIVGSSFIVKNK